MGEGQGEGATREEFNQGYRNRFSSTPWDVLHRPALRHPKPKVLGSQSARGMLSCGGSRQIVRSCGSGCGRAAARTAVGECEAAPKRGQND